MIQTRNRDSKWQKDENGESVTRECPVCKAEEEDWDHYDYERRGVKEMNEKVAESMGSVQQKRVEPGGRRDREGGGAEHSKSTMDPSLRESQVGQETTKETEYRNTDEQTDRRMTILATI